MQNLLKQKLLCKLSPIDIYVFLFSIAFGLKQILLSNGNVIQHYPGIGYDGLDWYTEGAFFVNWLFSAPPLPLPMLRPPIFVLICALDNYLGHAGYILGAVNGLCIFLTYWFLVKIIKVLKTTTEYLPLFSLPIAIGVTLHPLNYFKTYISFSDNLATTLSIIAFYYFLQYWMDGSQPKRNLFLSLFTYLVSGLTQTYGLISLLIGVTIYSWAYRRELKLAISAIMGSIGVLLFYWLIKYYWATLLPHEITAYNFSLLKLNFNMLSFYLNSWLIFFFPFPIIIILCSSKNGVIEMVNAKALAIPLTAVAILTLAFFYQMPEARYTSFALPWIISSLTLILSTKRVKIYIASMLIFLPMVAVPANYWIPTIKSVRIQESYRWNWLFDFWKAKSVNFNIRACEIECGDEWLSKYAKTYNTYNDLIIDQYGKSFVSNYSTK